MASVRGVASDRCCTLSSNHLNCQTMSMHIDLAFHACCRVLVRSEEIGRCFRHNLGEFCYQLPIEMAQGANYARNNTGILRIKFVNFTAKYNSIGSE
jgi:hypothetical protein